MPVAYDDPLRPSAVADRWRGLLGVALLWSFLLSPLVLWIVRGAAFGWRDPLFLFNVGASVLWLASFHFLTSRPFVLHLTLAPLYLTTAVDLFLLTAFDARLSSGYIGIALTDHADAGEMLSSYWRVILPVAVISIATYGVGLWLIRGTTQLPRRRLALGAMALLMGIYGVYVGRAVMHEVPLHRAVMDLAQKENSAPIGVLFQTALAADIYQRGAEFKARRSEYRYDARQVPGQAAPEVVVVVIGESSRPQNWSLFGYRRDTTPMLRAAPGVLAFPDLLTTAPHTAIAVPSLLSLDGIDRWEAIQARSSIVRAFAEAGFSTHWLSVQPSDSWAGLIPTIAEEASHRRYFDHKHDEVLLPELDAILARHRAGDRTLVVLHTKGSHFEFSRRYPPAFGRFDRGSPGPREKLIDTYDNSILYTDWFLAEVINRLSKAGRASVMLYASDHGENLHDDERNYFGHAIGTEYDLWTAGVFWLSEDLIRRQPTKVAAARANANSRLSLSDMPHSLLDISAISARGFDAQKSIFSRSFVPRTPRPFLVRGRLTDDSGLPAWKSGRSAGQVRPGQMTSASNAAADAVRP